MPTKTVWAPDRNDTHREEMYTDHYKGYASRNSGSENVYFSNKLDFLNISSYNGWLKCSGEESSTVTPGQSYALYGIKDDNTEDRLYHYKMTDQDRALYTKGYRLYCYFDYAETDWVYDTVYLWINTTYDRGYFSLTWEEITNIPVTFDGKSEIESMSLDGLTITSLFYDNNPIY